MIKEIEKRGLIDRVCLSMDITRKSHLKANGGIGYAYLLDTFIPLLRKNGIGEVSIQRMLVHNPMQFYQ